MASIHHWLYEKNKHFGIPKWLLPSNFVDFSHDIRSFLKKLGIWETVKSSFPSPTKTPK